MPTVPAWSCRREVLETLDRGTTALTVVCVPGRVASMAVVKASRSATLSAATPYTTVDAASAAINLLGVAEGDAVGCRDGRDDGCEVARVDAAAVGG